MLGATSFSLIVPGVEAAIAQGTSKPTAALILSLGILWLVQCYSLMLFVIVDEIIPEINYKGLAQEGTFGVLIGFVIMMFMDIAFG
jgi:zinc transporter ZupT